MLIPEIHFVGNLNSLDANIRPLHDVASCRGLFIQPR